MKNNAQTFMAHWPSAGHSARYCENKDEWEGVSVFPLLRENAHMWTPSHAITPQNHKDKAYRYKEDTNFEMKIIPSFYSKHINMY